MNQREDINQETIGAHPAELTQEGIARRNVLKAGAVGAGVAMVGLNISSAEAAGACPVPGVDIKSPPVTPWKDPLQRLFHMVPLANGIAGITGGTPGPRPVPGQADSKFKLLADHPELATATPYPDLAHQAWVDPASPLYFPPVEFYELTYVQHNHKWHSDMPAGAAGQPAWGMAPPGFDLNAAPLTANAPSIVPGPCFRTTYGVSHFVRMHNNLPDVATPDAISPLGFGTPVVTSHMHNQHTPSESDGNPLYWNYPGMFYDYHYPNVYAGVLQGFKSPVRGVAGDWREAGGSFWYHDHKLDFTSQNVYAGLAGFNCTYDECDTGTETPGSTGISFPAVSADSTIPFEFDVPLVFHDRQFDAAGVDFFPLACFDGAIGDAFTCNGTIKPVMAVQPRRYRFRVLDMGPSRFYWWWMRQGLGANFIPFIVISNDGNLLPNAVRVQSFKQAVAERFDIIVDFTGYKAGTEFFMVNRAEQVNGRSPTGKLLAPNLSFECLKFVVEAKRPGLTDNSTPITQGTPLRPLPPKISPLAPTKRQTWRFDRSGGEWTVNGIIFDRFLAPYTIPQGTSELWDIQNGGGSWSHPVHIHYEEHRYFQYNGAAQPAVSAPLETGRKDVIRLDPGALVRIGMQFRDYKGLYPMHCHNVVHEDHAMMVMWKII